MNNEYKKLNRIKELRKEKGVTQKEVAAVAGISQGMLTNYENGKRSPRDSKIWDDLAKYFNVSTGYIMGLDHDRKRVNWDEHDAKLTDSHFHSIDKFEKGIDLDKLDENITLRIDEKPLSKEERKALSLFIDALRELRK